MKYQVTVSGQVIVEVEADNPEQAKQNALTDTVAGELYNHEFDDVQAI